MGDVDSDMDPQFKQELNELITKIFKNQIHAKQVLITLSLFLNDLIWTNKFLYIGFCSW